MQYRVLGYLTVVRDDGVSLQLPRKQRELVAVLLLYAGRSCSREMLVRVLWGGALPSSPEQALRTCLCRARAALGPAGCLQVLEDGAIRAEPRGPDLDLTRFLDLRTAALRHLEHGYLQQAGAALEAALACWHDSTPAVARLGLAPHSWCEPLLADLPDAPETGARRSWLLDQRRTAWLTLADILIALGDAERILPDLHERVVADSLDEHVWAQLMLALYQSGRSSEALAAYSTARAEIVRGLGVEPGTELQDLRDRVAAGQPAILGAPWPAAASPPAPALTGARTSS